MILRLNEELSEKEQKIFMIPNVLKLDDFHGSQFLMSLGGVAKDKDGKYHYDPDYARTYIGSDITPNKLISFCELHKNIIHKEKSYINGRFTIAYYIIYSMEERPMLLNAFNNFGTNKVTIELIFNDNGFYRIDDVHLIIPCNYSFIGSIMSLFNENSDISALPFIEKDENAYKIIYYNFYGIEKEFRYNTLEDIFNHIVNIRLVECEGMESE